jgi:phosphoenolpyruvate-protein phosphotransferase (PTS system enzyme I)
VRSFHGQGLGGGIAIGRARVLRVGQLDVPLHILAAPQREAEVARFYQAINNAKSQLHSIALSLPDDAPPETRALIEVHRTMLDDPALSFAAQEKILDEGFNAHWAWVQQVDSMVAQFAEMDNEYLRERARDIQQIGQRVLVQLTAGRVDASIDGGAGEIIVAHDLDPAGLLHWKQAEGFAIDLGGVNSHTAIVARSLQRPSVIGLGAASEQVEDGMMVVLDGETGALTIEPSPEVLAAFRTKQAQQREQAQRRMQLVDVPATTLDGINIILQANIELPIEATAALKQGAQGIGLFRSEFLFLDRDTLPTEEEQLQSYCAALNAMQGREVTIRTIDVGADKALPQQKVDPPANPALGERAIRFSLKHPEIFMVQLRALLRASAFGPIRILIPMLAHRFEVTATKELLAHAREQLQREGIAMAPSVPIGAMIEIPAAAIEADWFAQAFDFLSIGTNDLVQYTLAVDRTDHQVAQLYDSHHPAVLSLISTTVNACLKYGKPVTVCGEMAGQPDSAQLLIGMGIRQLSMQPQSLLAVKERILKITSEPNNV